MVGFVVATAQPAPSERVLITSRGEQAGRNSGDAQRIPESSSQFAEKKSVLHARKLQQIT